MNCEIDTTPIFGTPMLEPLMFWHARARWVDRDGTARTFTVRGDTEPLALKELARALVNHITEPHW